VLLVIKVIAVPQADRYHDKTVRTIWTPATGRMEKFASDVRLDPQVKAFIETIKPIDGHTFKLLTGLGAADWWGQNRNGDRFYQRALLLNGPKYGYTSFLTAGCYRHHCFPAGTDVLMADRQRRPIEQVAEGDEVVTLDGVQRVTAVMRRPYVGAGVRLVLKGKRNDLVGTADHLVQVFKREQVHCRHNYSKLGDTEHLAGCPEARQAVGDPQWLPMSEVQPGDYLVFPRPEIGTERVPKEFAQLVGWVASEGYLGARGTIQFTFSESNIADINAVTECLRANGLHVSVTPRPQDGLVMLSSCSAELHRRLSKYIVGVKDEKRLTGEILSWDCDSLLWMLGAYIDGDGHVPSSGRNRGQLRIRSSSPAMLDILSDVLHGLDVSCAVDMDSPPAEMVSPTNGQIYIGSGSGCVAVAAALSPLVTQHSRKQFTRCGRSNEHVQLGDIYLVRVTDAEPVDLNEDVFNLEVAGPNHYVAEGVVVHNCNKDKNKTLGKVVFAFYNPFMRRVELVIDYDHKLIDAQDANDLLELVNPEYSMAAKVPWDVCFPAGTLVRTTRGYVPIETVQVGDVVRSHTGGLRRVLKVMQRPGADSVTVRAAGVPAAAPTANHPYLVLRRDDVRTCQGSANGARLRHQPDDDGLCKRCGRPMSWSPAWVAAGDLHVGDYLLTPVDGCHDVVGDCGAAKVLGYYLGDGHIVKQRSGKRKTGPYKDVGFSITVGTDSQEHLNNVVAALAGRFKNEPNVYDMGAGRHAVAVNVHDQAAAAWLQAHGGRTSSGKRISEDVFNWSREEKLSLLGGYVDTDGCVDARGSIRISTINRGLALDTQRLLHSVGVPASVGGGGTTPLGDPAYNVFIPASAAAALRGYAWKASSCSDDTTASTQSFFWGGYWCTPVTAVEEAVTAETVYNLSVEQDESYIVEGVAVHNCTICGDMAGLEKLLDGAPGSLEDRVKHVLEQIKVKPLKGVSTKREHYCDHLKYMMGQVIQDGPDQGKQVGAHNTHPEFFDISQVTTGADVSAKEMMKLASANGTVVGGAELAEMLGYQDESELYAPTMTKAASVSVAVNGLRERVKQAALERRAAMTAEAEMDKTIDAIGVPLSVNQEKEIPHSTLSSVPMRDLLSTLGSLGIVLRPEEFQRLTLSNLGAPNLANAMDRGNLIFPPTETSVIPPMGPQFVTPNSFDQFLPFMENRSCLSPISDRRVAMIVFTKSGSAAPTPRDVVDTSQLSEEHSEMIAKCASLYRGYREGLADCATALVRCASTHQGVRNALWEDGYLANNLAKSAAAPSDILLLGSLFPLLYLYSAHLRKSEAQGEKLGLIRRFVKEHPVISAGAVVGLLKTMGVGGAPKP